MPVAASKTPSQNFGFGLEGGRRRPGDEPIVAKDETVGDSSDDGQSGSMDGTDLQISHIDYTPGQTCKGCPYHG